MSNFIKRSVCFNSLTINTSTFFVNVTLLFVLEVVLFKAMLFGQEWNSLNGPIYVHRVQDIVIGKDQTTQKIYAADVETLKVSTNAGSNWNIFSPIYLSPTLVACMPTNPNDVAVAKINAVKFLVNGEWLGSNLPGISTFIPTRLVYNHTDDPKIFLGIQEISNDVSSIWSTPNHGQIWDAGDFDAVSNTNVNDILPFPGGTLSPYSNYVWVAGSEDPLSMPANPSPIEPIPQKGLWRTTNGGVNWNFQGNLPLEAGNEKNVSALGISIGPSEKNLFVAVVTSNAGAKLYFSSSNSIPDLGEQLTLLADLNVSPLFIQQVRAIKTNPVDYQHIAMATDKGFAVSTNRGTSWILSNNGLENNIDVTQVVYNLNDVNGNTLYLATSLGVYQSTNRGGDWTRQNSGLSSLSTSSVSLLNGNAAAVFQTYPGISNYQSGMWDIVPTMLGEGLFFGEYVAINRNDANFATACGSENNQAVIYTRTNGMNNWTKCKSVDEIGTKFVYVVADHRANSQRVYAGGKSVYGNYQFNFSYSSNKGISWTDVLISLDATSTVTSIAVDASGVTNSTVYAGLNNGKGVYKSTNDGENWTYAGLSGSSITSLALNSATSTLANTIYIGLSNAVWKTANKFVSASSLTENFGAKRMIMHPSYPNDAQHLWIVTADGNTIYKTVNGGTNWIEVNTSTLPKPMNDIGSEANNNALIYIATSSGVYRIDSAPEAPTGVSVGKKNNGNGTFSPFISWYSNQEADLNTTISRYRIYRYFREWNIGEETWGPPSSASLIAQTLNTYYTDVSQIVSGNSENWRRAGYYVRATDIANNASDTSRHGEITVTDDEGIGEEKTAFTQVNQIFPTDFSLSQNYPNPFNPTTDINFALLTDAFISLKVYDMFGKEIITLVDENVAKGFHVANFNANNVASGMYYYRLVALQEGDVKYTATKKMLMIK